MFFVVCLKLGRRKLKHANQFVLGVLSKSIFNYEKNIKKIFIYFLKFIFNITISKYKNTKK
jgi:hypothetical protein